MLTDYAPVAGSARSGSASHTYIGDKPYEQMGQTVVARVTAWWIWNVKFNQEKAISYSYEAELGTLDYAPPTRRWLTRWWRWPTGTSTPSRATCSNMAAPTPAISSQVGQPFSASDHDPVIVDLKLKGSEQGVAAPWAPCCWPCCRSPGAVAKTRHPRCQVQSPR